MNLKYAIQNLKKLPARALWTLKAVPSGLRGELTMASAQLEAVHIKADGTRRNLGVIARKKVTRAFVLYIAANLAADVTAFGDFKFHDSGVGTTSENNTDTAIETTDGESRATGTQVDSSSASVGIYSSVGTISYTTTKAITEHGLFNIATAGTLMDRSVFSAVNVVSGDSIQFTYTLSINPEA